MIVHRFKEGACPGAREVAERLRGAPSAAAAHDYVREHLKVDVEAVVRDAVKRMVSSG